jgi:SWI/SNF-related matrix-associated actin-dependent regulator 1 of chromatin subfamily A
MSAELLHPLCERLAGICDGALRRDDVGFNRMDSIFGKSLAARPPSRWTPKQSFAAWHLLQKYHRQIPEIRAIPRPVDPKIVAPMAGGGGGAGILELSEDRALYLLKFPYSIEAVGRVKALPRRRWDKDRRAWTVPAGHVEWSSALLSLAIEESWALGPGVREAVEADLRGAGERLAASKASESTGWAPKRWRGTQGLSLLPYQAAGVRYLVERERTFLADEMGLGKTVQALVALEELDAYPAIILCPASLKENWRREAFRWLPGRSVEVLSGAPGEGQGVRPSDLVILNYDILADTKTRKGWGSLLLAPKPRAIVCDESHKLKEPKSKRTEAARVLASWIPYRFCLSGTPILNRPAELISQLKILGRLDDIGGWRTFADRYCGRHWNGFTWDMSGARNLDELNTKLRIHGYIRRTKVDVLPELPQKRRVTVPLEGLDLSEYRSAAADLREWLEEKFGKVEADAAARAEALTRIEVLKQLAFRAKSERCLEWVREFLEDSDQKLVVFAWHRSAVQDMALALDAPYITGDVPPHIRQKAIDKFQHDPGTRVIVGNIQAMGVGLTLTAASNVVFLELPWTPAECDQAEDRCHRIGQKSSVTAWYLLAPGTIDADIESLLEEKRRVVDGATEASAQGASIFGSLVGKLRGKA